MPPCYAAATVTADACILSVYLTLGLLRLITIRTFEADTDVMFRYATSGSFFDVDGVYHSPASLYSHPRKAYPFTTASTWKIVEVVRV